MNVNQMSGNQLPGGSMGPRYVLQLLFSEKITKLLITQQPLKLEKKISADLESLEFYIF
jgi:hypothetical protein